VDLRFLTTVADLTALAWANLRLYTQVESLASEDALTGLFVRYRFDERLRESFAMAKSAEVPLCLVMFDVDFFKNANDTYGHAAGDQVLKHIAGIIRRNCRDTDFAARYGGEELAVIMLHTRLKQANVFAERVRQTVETEAITYQNQKIPVTLSAGTAVLTSRMSSPEEFLARVDEALYRAKSAGRNRIATAGQVAIP
jgi:diguanylate cyclase (GGDEF)-like protein